MWGENMNYTLCLIQYHDQLLLLNREKKPWMGRWNGIGGKFEKGENALLCVKREIKEETGLDALNIKFEGLLKWSINDIIDDGTVFIFSAHVDKIETNFPLKTREGILDLKSIKWATDFNNLGLVTNLRLMIPNIMNNETPKKYVCNYKRQNVDYLDSEIVEKEEVFELTKEEREMVERLYE